MLQHEQARDGGHVDNIKGKSAKRRPRPTCTHTFRQILLGHSWPEPENTHTDPVAKVQ